MCKKAGELEVLNFNNYLARRQPWWRPATFQFLFGTAVHTVSYTKNKMSFIRLCMCTYVHYYIHYVGTGQSIAFSGQNAILAIPPLVWPVNCIKIGGHVALLSVSTF